MLSEPEKTLLNSLTDADALEQLADLDLSPECVPTSKLYEIIDWACAYFMRSGHTQAPGRVELMHNWGPALEAMGAELESEDVQIPQVSWAVTYLKEQYALAESQPLIMEGAKAIASADLGERSGAILDMAHRLFALADATSSRRTGDNAADGLEKSLARYEHRRINPEARRGLGLGLPEVDDHTGGIQRGELGGLMSLQKTGKSMSALWCGWRHIEDHENTVATIFTLENTVESAFDRLACMAFKIDYTAYQRGTVDPKVMEELRDWLSDRKRYLASRLFIMRPGIDGGRTAASMCAWARRRGSDAVIFDQLSHIEITRTHYRSVTEETKRAMNELVDALSDDGELLSGLVLHQAKRAAAEEAKKTGSLGEQGAGGTSEFERAVDLHWGLYQSEDDKASNQASLELLNFRRGPAGVTWGLIWKPWIGDIRVIRRPVEAVSHGR